MCAQKLQQVRLGLFPLVLELTAAQWDILTDLAKHEGNNELSLECAWRLTDWVAEREQIETAIKGLNPAPTPRKRVYEAYMALVRSRTSNGSNAEDKKNFERALDDGMQLALRKWFYLPDIVGESHVPLLQLFQQFVELQEAGGIFGQLATTTATNLDARSQELKNTLMTWRERLPNLWDDINVWSDIVAWRQHVFSAINSAYMPLVPQGGQGAQSQNNNSHAYRGFHEAAWIINRFAHVARKHELSEVCLSSLTKIYTLPNIEIQEAFLKLREQAKCHFQNPSELTQGLEVISNTNLSFFGPAQKAEFFTLKGMYLAKLGMHDEVSTVFNQALTMDMTYPKVRLPLIFEGAQERILHRPGRNGATTTIDDSVRIPTSTSRLKRSTATYKPPVFTKVRRYESCSPGSFGSLAWTTNEVRFRRRSTCTRATCRSGIGSPSSLSSWRHWRTGRRNTLE